LDFNFDKMTFIKHLLYLLLLPTVTYGQTVHIDDNRIVYKGAVSVGQINKDELYETAKKSIYAHRRSKMEKLIPLFYSLRKFQVSVK